ncbi:Uncharacterised protein [Psychrobacter phenylpyruvicus]|uniref:Uncharacterized protein n=1 Tax=Psychrobacter phenylpyruvicus TaxID=29432 RepID=A0A379LS04_9GAMM|nr:Uncharacterised protein [Psychrobacter phenylpyruvicus]
MSDILEKKAVAKEAKVKSSTLQQPIETVFSSNSQIQPLLLSKRWLTYQRTCQMQNYRSVT